MYYISREKLIDSILNEAIAMDDDGEFNKPRRRSLRGTGNVFDDIYRKPPFKRYGETNTANAKRSNSRGGQAIVNIPTNKLIITPPNIDTCLYVFGKENPYGIDRAKLPSDHQGAQTVIYWTVLFDFGLIHTPPSASKKIAAVQGNETSVNKAIKRVENILKGKKWSPDTPIEQIGSELDERDPLLNDPDIKKHTNAALTSPLVKDADDFHAFIIKSLENSRIATDNRHTMTVLENKAARSISAVDMRMRKAGYTNGIMDVMDMFDYIKRTNPRRYSFIMDKYDLSPEFIEENIHNYSELCDWIYRPERLPQIWLSADIKTRAKKSGDYRRTIDLAVQSRTENKKYSNAKKYVDNPELAPKRGKNLEYYQDQLDAAMDRLSVESQKLKSLIDAGLGKGDIEYDEQELVVKKARKKVSNAKTAIRVTKAKIEAGEPDQMETSADKMKKHRGAYRDTLTTARGNLDQEHLEAFDMDYDYPKIMREINPSIPTDLFGDMFEFSFTLMEENGNPVDRHIAEFIDKWANKHYNKVEIENGYEGCINVTVVEMDVEDENNYDYTKMVRIIFDYPDNSYMNTILTGENARQKADNIVLEICDEVEVETDVVLKWYLGEGHGIVIHEPSADFLK